MDRKFIGIEIELKYFDIACRRIEEEYRRGDFLGDGRGMSKKSSQKNFISRKVGGRG